MKARDSLIANFFPKLNAGDINLIAGQIESLVSLTARILGSDLLVVFHRVPQSDEFAAIGYHFNGNIPGPDSTLLETLRKIGLGTLQTMPGIIVDLKKGKHRLATDALPRLDLRFGLTVPCHIDGKLGCMAVACWCDVDRRTESEAVSVINNLLAASSRVILAAGRIIGVRQTADRLHGLIGIASEPIGEDKIVTYESTLMRKMTDLLPGVRFCIIYRDPITGKLQLRHTTDPQMVSTGHWSSIGKSIMKQLGKYPIGDDWLDLGDLGGEAGDLAAIIVVGREKKREILLLALPNPELVLSARDRDLLTRLAQLLGARYKDALIIKSLKQTNRLLEQSSDQLRSTETLAALSDMASGMAHDFNNIIGGIIGRVQLMKLKHTDENVAKDLNTIERQLLEGAHTVRSLQDFGTSTKYKKPESLDWAGQLTEYFRRKDQKWGKMAAEKKVNVSCQQLVERAGVKGSADDLCTALDKLLENAVEHSPEGASVEVILDQTKQAYRLSVVDHGDGIDEKIIKRVFYPFFTTKESRAAGLGLAIVHGIAGRHNGTCRVRSELQKGAVFELEIPMADGEKEDSDVTRKRRKVGSLHIMVVDDDEQIREVLSDMLTIGGHIVTTCSDGFEALEEFRRADIDLLITDLGMVGMSGLDLAGIVHDERPEVPVALITGWGSQLNQDEVALKGVKAVLAKPFHLDEINATVEKLVPAED